MVYFGPRNKAQWFISIIYLHSEFPPLSFILIKQTAHGGSAEQGLGPCEGSALSCRSGFKSH